MTVLLTGLLGLFGGSSFQVAFRPEDLVQPVLLAAVLGAASSWLVTGLLRRGPVLAALAGVAAAVGAGIPAGFFDVLGLRDGPLSIVQTPTPVPANALELTVPYVTVWLAAFWGTEIAQRSAAPVLPLLPSFGVFLVGLILGGAGQDLALWGPLAWTACSLTLIGWRSRLRDPASSSGVRTGLVTFSVRGGKLLAVATVLALGAGTVAHGMLEDQDRTRFELDDREAPEPAGGREFNPLTRVTTLHSGPNEALFDVDTSAPIDRWRLVVLDTYDGQSWSSDLPFLPTGRALAPLPPVSTPDPELLEGPPIEIDQVVEPTAVGRQHLGTRLPAAGRPVEVDRDDLLFQVESGTLAVDEDLPDRYSATSEVAWPDLGQLVDADVASDPEANAALELPDELTDDDLEAYESLESFGDLARELTDGIDSPYGQAVALESHFTQFELAYEEPPSGHSLGHLIYFLDSDIPYGSPEQFAASYALLARLAGLPSRVVVGFEGHGVAGEHSVMSHWATAWVEVKFEDVGWVDFQPVPAHGSAAGPPEDVAGSDEVAAEDEERNDDEDDEGEDAAQDGGGAEGDDGSTGSPMLLTAGGILALLALVVAAPAVRRAWRRRRQRRGDSAFATIVGAWEATLDVLRTAGVPIGEDLGALDVVAATQPHLGDNMTGGPGVTEPLGHLGRLVNRALFAPDPLGDRAASRAWELRDDIARDYRRRRSTRQALRDYFTGR